MKVELDPSNYPVKVDLKGETIIDKQRLEKNPNITSVATKTPLNTKATKI